MGEIADDMINGDFDFFTGEYIGRGNGFPRTKNKTLPWESSKVRSDNWKIVTAFLNKSGIKPHLHTEVMKSYAPIYYAGKRPLKNACIQALKNFEKFKMFIINTYKTLK